MGSILTYNGKTLTSGSKWVYQPEDPLNPFELPPYTVRLLFEPGIVPETRVRGVFHQVSASPNIWDLTTAQERTPGDWTQLLAFNNLIDYSPLAMIGANSTNVMYMSEMFHEWGGITSVPIFDTSSVIDMSGMFSGFTTLTSVPLYDTSSATNMSGMFEACNSLTSVPQYDTSSATNLFAMFRRCTSLTAVPYLDTSSCIYFANMFDGCTGLTTVPTFDTSSGTIFYDMFYGCTGLRKIPLFDTGRATNMGGMFSECINVESGALALYQQASTQSTPPSSHIGTFKNTGSNNVSGAAELAQIPSDWK